MVVLFVLPVVRSMKSVVPSGDQEVGKTSVEPTFVRRVTRVGFDASATYTSPASRIDANATRVPSGDHTGPTSLAGSNVKRVIAFLPTSKSQRSSPRPSASYCSTT